MNPNAILTLVIIIIAVAMLISNRIRSDLVALLVLLALGLSGIVAPDKIFSGFSSSAVITILGISLISIGLQTTGVTNSLGRILHRIGGKRETILVFLVTFISAAISLFMNNVAAVGVLLPAVMSLSRKSKVSPSRLLIPLAFGTILGGMATLLTTSNIIVSGALKDAGHPSFGLLDYFPVGGPAALIGIIFITFVGRKLIPVQKKVDKENRDWSFHEAISDFYELNSHLLQFTLLPESPLINRTVEQIDFSNQWNLNILSVIRGKKHIVSPLSETKISAGDIVIATGTPPSDFSERLGVKILHSNVLDKQTSSDSSSLAELMINPHSKLIGKTLKDIGFRESYGINIIGVWRRGKPIHNRLADLELHFGDALLVQGSALQIHKLKENTDLLILQEDPDAVLLPRKGLLSLLITIVTLIIAAFDILPIALVVFAGAALMLLAGCMNLNDAFQQIEWKVIFLIAGLWPLSIAVNETGLASTAVTWLLKIPDFHSPLLITAIFLATSMLLTLVISGQVSALIMIPLAITAAKTVGIDARPLALAVAMGCSLAFITPLGHPVNIMVMNPGGYTFRDYFRIGFPLTILIFVSVLVAIQLFWGL